MNAVNWDAVLETTMGDEELARDIASAFMDETPTLFQTLETNIAAANPEEARRAAHTIKGSLRMMSAQGMDTAKQLEEFSAEENWARCAILVQQLKTELNGVYAELNERLD